MSRAGSSGRFSGHVVTDAGATYQIQGELGRGGMGVVYRAHDPHLGRAVALKVGLASEAPGRLERFQREGEIAASLDHPGIVRVHSSGSIGGRPYLCFELVENCESLDAKLPRAPLAERLGLLQELGQALGYAHGLGVVHRDVKPENVLVDSAGRARLMDFGVARGVGQERLTGTGTALGTPFYAAPEQLRDGHRVGPPADVWSLGVILYQALTSELPFKGESLLALVAQITSGIFEPPRRLSPSVSPELEAVCLRALRTDPAERYADGAEFAADLGRAQRGERPLAQAKVGGRGKRVAGGLLLALPLLGAGLFVATQSPGDNPAPSAAPSPSPSAASWRDAAQAALTADDPRAALAALEGAPETDGEANTLRARAWIGLGRGQRALTPIRRLPPGVPRGVLALQAQVEGATSAEAAPLLEGIPLGERDPEFSRWRFLEACARPAPLEEIERAYRRIRRGNPSVEPLQRAVGLHQNLAGFSWPTDAIWALGEDSQHDSRLTKALEFLGRVQNTSLEDPVAQRALHRGVQRWMLPRLRFALSRLHEDEWRALAEPGADLVPSPEADEARLLILAGVSNAMDEIIPPPLEGPQVAWIQLSSERAAALPPAARRLFLAALLARGVTSETSLETRRQLTRQILALFPSKDEARTLTLRQSQGVEAGKEACLIEVLRCTEEAWLASSKAERQAALQEARARLSATRLRCLPKWLLNDWRYLVAQLRLAALSGDLSFFSGPEITPWTDTRRQVLRASYVLELQLLRGDLQAARRAAEALGKEELSGWTGLVRNQLLFLEDSPQGPQPTETRGDHPFPWRQEAPTRRLLDAGWRPGQPLFPALEAR